MMEMEFLAILNNKNPSSYLSQQSLWRHILQRLSRPAQHIWIVVRWSGPGTAPLVAFCWHLATGRILSLMPKPSHSVRCVKKGEALTLDNPQTERRKYGSNNSIVAVSIMTPSALRRRTQWNQRATNALDDNTVLRHQYCVACS